MEKRKIIRSNIAAPVVWAIPSYLALWYIGGTVRCNYFCSLGDNFSGGGIAGRHRWFDLKQIKNLPRWKKYAKKRNSNI